MRASRRDASRRTRSTETNGIGTNYWPAISAALTLAAIGFIPGAALGLEPPRKTSSPASVRAATPPQPGGGPPVAKAELAFRRDAGPAAGPARQAGLKRLGRLRLRRSEEIGGSPWGVSCHWIADEHPLEVQQRVEHVSALGIKWAFLVPDWDRIEREKGKYDWNAPSHRLDDVVTGLVRRKVTPIIQIYGGNRLYMPAQMDPNKRQLADAARLLDDAEVRQAWHRFLEALVRRYRPHVRVWEIWNEPNGPWFWQTPTSVQDYGRMVKAVAEIIRRVQPEALILAGSTANVPRDYLEAFLSSDGAGSFNHWAVLPYGDLPEASDAQIRSAAELLRARGKSPVLWQSECGFPSSADTAGWGYGGAWDETKHAKWVLRRLLSDAALGMPVSIYFVLHDYPAMLEGGPNQGRMGINRKGLYWYGSWERKPAAHAMAHLSSLLDDRWEPVTSAQPIRFEITAPGSLTAAKTEQIKLYRLKHKLSGQPALVYWLGVPMATAFHPARATLTWPGAQIAQPVLVDLLDGEVYAVPHETQSGELRIVNLPLADSPLVLCSRNAAEFKIAAPLSGWRWHRTISLDPPTRRPGDVVPVVFNTDVFGSPYRDINPDGSDVRFTTADTGAPLDYWIERWDRAGVSRIWVKVPDARTERILVWYGNAAAKPGSAARAVFDFFDDFDDGIWTKHEGNPVMTRTKPWETRVICEPSILFEDGGFKMWYMGCRSSEGYNAALGYATSPDGFAWTKHPGNPILRDPKDAVIRTTVIKHQGTYYLYASDHQWTPETGVINRWVSKDGLNWTDKTTVLRPTQPWEKHFHNVHVLVDEDGAWKMLYTTDGPWGCAHSKDGLHWTKHKDPVVTGFYGGDPYLTKIGGTYYAWHSRAHQGHLRIYCRSSSDMVHWEETHNGPQLGYTQPWERGIGRPEVYWDRHLADAELLEHAGKVRMYYGGAQCPLGVAVFDGTFAQLAARLKHPPLSKWTPSHYGCVENKELKISDTETDTEPICQRAARSGDPSPYVVEFRARCYAGYRQERTETQTEGWASPTRCLPASTRRMAAVMRYVDNDNFARFRTENDETTYYEERTGGVWKAAANVGPNRACDGNWRQWKIVVDGENNTLYIDGRYVGRHKSSPALANRKDLRIGFSVRDSFASFDDVRVRNHCDPQPQTRIGNAVSTAEGRTP